MNKKYLVLKYTIKYLILIIIFKNIHYLIGIHFEELNKFYLVYIPLAFLVVKFLVYYDLEKNKLTRKDILVYLVLNFTIINLIFRMAILYTISIFIFLFILRNDQSKLEEVMTKNISEYLNNNVKQDKK